MLARDISRPVLRLKNTRFHFAVSTSHDSKV